MSNRTLLTTAIVIAASSFYLHAEPLNDEGFQKLMKEVGSATKRFKNQIQNKDSAGLSKDATRVAEIYKQMAPFWVARKADDAAKWSEESAASATLLAAAARNSEWDKVKTGSQGVMKNCKACHDAHREKLPDGSSRIK